MTVTSDQQRTARGSRTTTAVAGRRRGAGAGCGRTPAPSGRWTSAPWTLETGGSLPSVQVAYETWGTLNAAARQRHPGRARPDRRQPRRRPRRSRASHRRLVGRADRPGPPTGHRPVVRHREQRARRVPGHDRAVLTGAGRPAVGQQVPVRHRPRPGRRRGRARGRPRHRLLGLRDRRLDGRDAGAGVGGHPPLRGCARPIVLASSAATPRPSRSPGASRSCWPSARTRTSTAATTTTSRRDRDLGLGLARRIAHVTYRSELELATRFGREAQDGEQPLGAGGRYAVESYLDHHADKLARRFDANSYLVLTESMNSHDVGRGRGGVASRAGAGDRRPGGGGGRLRPALPPAAVRGDRRGRRLAGRRCA